MAEAAARKGWTRVAFGDVVRQVKDKVDPETARLDRYIAGEHMDTDDLRLRRWGEIGSGYLGPAFHMRFKPGQVLYGSRRTYLRKVALADFEGITANTTYVLESADAEVLLPELLPFIMQTEAFHEHSKHESKGSVNPYVNFSDLAWYEFRLPPIEEQKRVAELGRSHLDLLARLAELSSLATSLLAVRGRDLFDSLSDHDGTRLADICQVRPHSGVFKSKDGRGSGQPMVNMGELFGGDTIDASLDMERVTLSKREADRFQLDKGDLLFGRRSVVLEGAGRCVLVGSLSEATVFESSVLRARLDPTVADFRFVFEWLRSPRGHQQIRRIVTFTTVSGVAGSDVARLPIPLPSLAVQRGIADELAQLRIQVTRPSALLAQARSLSGPLLEQALDRS